MIDVLAVFQFMELGGKFFLLSF